MCNIIGVMEKIESRIYTSVRRPDFSNIYDLRFESSVNPEGSPKE